MEKTNTLKKERNAGLDLLRIVCMFMIVCGHGFISGAASLPGEMRWVKVVSDLLSTFCGVAVNCFVLISGYFLAAQKFRFSRLIRLAVEVLFYSWGILLVSALLLHRSLSISDLLTLVLPISYGHFWFISAYFGLSLLAPVLNWGLTGMTQRQHLLSIVILFVGFSLWSDVLPRANPFGAGSGYCLTWFVVLYVVAAYIRKYVSLDTLNCKKTMGVYLSMMLLVFSLNTAMSFLSARITALQSYEMDTFFSRYNCSLVAIASVGLFCTFSGMKVEKPFMIRLTQKVSGLTLGVYLIHGGAYTSAPIWNAMFGLADGWPALLHPVKVILLSAILFLLCLGIDYLRSLLFGLWEKWAWYARLMKKADEMVYRAGNWITAKMHAGEQQPK